MRTRLYLLALCCLLAVLLAVSPAMAARQVIVSGAGVYWVDEKDKINANFIELYNKDAALENWLALLAVETWSATPGTYAENEMVLHGGKLYVAGAGGASGSDDPTVNTAQWTEYGGGGASSFGELTGDPADNAALAAALTAKQDALTTVTQEEAEAGTSTTVRNWTPERVAQAVAALAPVGAGDIDGVTASTGLTGGGTTGTVTVAVDPTYVQRRVSAECPVGQSIRKVYEDGTVDCEFDDGSGSTNLTNTTTATTVTVVSSAGADTVLPAATTTDAGVMTAADRTKLDGIDTGAADDQTGAEIKLAYEAEPDTNGYTDAEKAKLAGIGDGATNDRASHTGTQTSSTISDFDVAVSQSPAVVTNSLKNSFPVDAQAKLAGIEDGATADQSASEVPFTPAGTIAATNLQDAVVEVANEMTGANLANSPDADSVLITSSSGTNTDVPAATTSLAGVMSAADKIAIGKIGAAIPLSDCSTITVNQICRDTDDGKYYTHNGTEVVEIPTGPFKYYDADETTITFTGTGTEQDPHLFAVVMDGSGNNGNLPTTVDTPQELLDYVDDMSLGGGVITGLVLYSDATCTPDAYYFNGDGAVVVCTSSGDLDYPDGDEWTALAPSTWALTLTIVDASALGGTWTVNGTEGPYAVGASPVSITGLPTGAATITYNGSELGNCTGTGVTGTADTGPFSVAENDGVSVTCTETASGGGTVIIASNTADHSGTVAGYETAAKGGQQFLTTTAAELTGITVWIAGYSAADTITCRVGTTSDLTTYIDEGTTEITSTGEITVPFTGAKTLADATEYFLGCKFASTVTIGIDNTAAYSTYYRYYAGAGQEWNMASAVSASDLYFVVEGE